MKAAVYFTKPAAMCKARLSQPRVTSEQFRAQVAFVQAREREAIAGPQRRDVLAWAIENSNVVEPMEYRSGAS